MERMTTKVLAHRDRAESRRPIRISLTLAEIHGVLEEVGSVAKKYYRLRHPGVELATVTPHADLQFLDMFTKPWWSEGFSPPDAFTLG